MAKAVKEPDIDVKFIFSKSELDIPEILELKENIVHHIKLRHNMEKVLNEYLDKKDSESYNTRIGIVYWMLNRHDKAVPLLEAARSSHLTNYFLGLSYQETDKPEKAYELLKKLYKDEPNKLYFICPMVSALIRRGEIEEAFKILENAKKDHRSEADIYCYTGWCFEYLGEYKKADAEYQHALRLEPEHSETLFRMAYRADLQGKDEQAIKLYEKLCDQRPTYFNALINLGIMYEDKSEFDKAISCYESVLEYSPVHPKASLYLKDAKAAQNMYYNDELKRREQHLKNIMSIPITDFPMSIRSRACLEDLGIKILGDLAVKTEDELLKCDNFGMTSLNELREIMARKGLTFAQPGVVPGQPATVALPIIEEPNKKPDMLNKSIFDMEWSARIRSCFGRLKIYTLRDLVSKSERELLDTKNLGQISVKEIKQRLAALGLSLAQGAL
ncbi:MAG: tetratricopeptide repeat protein [Planctomycetes bacterium]|nr:tetratricopeptide repeat protein [Planctomycetota bacterium]